MGDGKAICDRFVRGQRLSHFRTQSGLPLKHGCAPSDLEGMAYAQDIGAPGDYPLTRGIFPDMYRGRFWSQRPSTGFGTPRMAPDRVKFLYSQGATAWSLAPDGPPNTGLDPDHPLAQEEVGLYGTSICCLEDMEAYLAGFPQGTISVNLVVSRPGHSFVLGAYVASAEKQRIPAAHLLGRIQDDPINQLGLTQK